MYIKIKRVYGTFKTEDEVLRFVNHQSLLVHKYNADGAQQIGEFVWECFCYSTTEDRDD